MNAFWSQLSTREQLFIRIALGVFVFVLITGLVVPRLRAAEADSKSNVQAGLNLHEWVLRETASAAPAPTSAAPARISRLAGDIRQPLIDAAAQRGLVVSRLQKAGEDRLQFQFEDAPAPLIFAWLADAERTLGIAPVRAMLDAHPSGNVRASIEFEDTAP